MNTLLSTPDISAATIAGQVASALNEDVGDGDLTASLVPANTVVKATVISREPAVLCGTRWFDETFHQLDDAVQVHWRHQDTELVSPNELLCELQGSARALLTGERTALNFLQTLSATATITRRYVDAIKHTECKVLDTRKTIPGLRLAQKYAVACGGGTNHRIGLFDAILIKENHIITAGSVANAIRSARLAAGSKMVEIEVESLEELQQALHADIDRILIDNFSLSDMRKAVELRNAYSHHRIELESSGNVTLDNICEIAETGVDFISVGALTKHVKAIDLSMRFEFSELR